MSNKTTKLTAELEIKALVNRAQQEIAGFGADLAKMWQSGEPPKKLLKSVEGLRQKITSLEELAQKGVLDSSELKNAKSEYEAFSKTIRALKIEFKLLTEEQKIATLGKKEQENIRGREEAMKAYTRAIKKNKEEQEKIDKQITSKNDTKTQKVAERQAKKTELEGFSPQSKKLAENYAKELEEIKKLEEDILEQEKLMDKYKKQGLSDSAKANNKLTQTREKWADLQAQKMSKEAQISADSQGKEAYQQLQPLLDTISKLNIEISEIDTELNQLNKASENFGKEGAERFEELKASLQKLGVEGIDTADNIEDLQKAVLALKNKALSEVDDNIIQIQKELDKLGGVADETGKEIDSAMESLDNKERMRNSQEEFSNKIKQFLGLSGAAQVLRASLRDAMQTIKELDATMTEMAVVTDLKVSDYWDQLPEYTNRANALGLAINDVYQADTLFYQQGLKTNEVVEISTETMKMARIAGLDTAEATNRMTAALRGFNMELNQASAQKVADVYSELAAITAADTEEISSAMTKTASIASNAGMEFETTAAFLSQIIETTRESAETAGTAMKTIIARFQELKKDPAEIGEVDGEIVDANKIEGALRSVGVALRDSSGQFRDLDDVFLELAEKWDGLDKNTQRYIATIAAGSRQQSRFLAMMSDYGRTQELVTAANTSAGASNDQFGKTLDSLESKVAKLKNAWHEFTMGILDSDLVKFGVDILTKFLEVINKATGAFDGLGGSLTKIAGTLVVFKMGQKIFEKLKAPLASFFAEIIAEAGKTGEKAGDAAVRGMKKSKQKTANTSDKPSKEPQTLGGVIKEKSGWSDLQGGFKALKGGTQQAQKNYLEKKEKGLKAQKEADRQAEFKAAQEDWDKKKYRNNKDPEKIKAAERRKKAQEELNKEIEVTKEELALTAEEQKQIAIQSKDDAWKQLGNGLTQMGQAALGAGTAVSMLGGVLSSLGLEEAGETVSTIGNGIMMLGTAMMAIPPIISAIQAILAVPPLGIIMVILAAVLATIIAIVTVINNNSPEKKLEKAQEAADAAAEVANNAAEAYDKLAESLDNLGDKYDSLEELTRGTKEWNEAVRNINNSVLELIDEYPELAKFVENKEGVLTLNVESDEVQNVLKQAEGRKIATKNQQVMADIAVTQAQNDVNFGELEAVKEIANKRGWDTFGKSVGTGAAIGGTVTGAVGAGIGTLGGPIGSLVLGGLGAALGAGAGAIVGTIVGAIAGPIEASKTKTDKTLQDAVGSLAESVANGSVGTDYDSMFTYLTESLGMAADEAEILAKQFSNDLTSLSTYGEAINAAEAQQRAAYNSIATSAQSLANTLSMTDEQIKQSSVLVDGDLAGELYEQKMAELADVEIGKDITKDEQVLAAIQETYGSNAKIDKKGKVTYTKDGENKEVTLSAEEIKSMIATQYATKESAKAIENSDEAISRVAEAVGSQIGDTEAAKAAVNALYMQNEGGALTQADLTTLQDSKIDFEKIWGKLSDDERAAYGNDIENLKEDFSEAISIATEDFEKAGDAVRDFMTADMAVGFKEKLDEVAELAGGETAKIAIQNATDTLLSGQEEDTKREIQSRINATDWSNLEALLALQIDLEQQYGFTTEQAKAYVDEIATSAFATSKLTTTVHVFGDLWKANEKIVQSVKRLTELQWQYNRALSGQGGAIQELTEQILTEYSLQAEQHVKGYEAANDNIARIYAQGGLNYGVDLREAVQLGQYGIEVDQSRLDEFVSGGKISQEDADAWLEKLNEQYENADEHYSELRKTLESIEELEQQAEDAYYELRDMVKDAIVSGLQEQIDLQQQTLDTTREANAALINKIQEQINDNRQARQNEEAEKNIENLHSQAAYLAMDTSGASDLQSLEVNKQIEEAEQSYQDSLIDQTVQNLSDANAKAEEQRERQINLAQMSLEEYQKSTEFQSLIDQKLDEMLASTDWENSDLGQLLKDKFTEGMSSEEAENWADEMGAKVGAAESWKTTDWGEKTNNIEAYLAALAEKEGAKVENLSGEAAKKKVANQVSQITSGGLSSVLSAGGYSVGSDGSIKKADGGELSKEDEQVLNTLSSYTEREGSAPGELDSRYNTISKTSDYLTARMTAGKTGPMSREEYYAKYQTDILSGKHTETYNDYLSNFENEKKEYDKQIKDFPPNAGPIGATTEGFNDREDAWFNLTLWGENGSKQQDKKVETGSKASNQSRLTELYEGYGDVGVMDDQGYRVVLSQDGGEEKLYISKTGGTWYEVLDQGANLTSNKDTRPSGLIEFTRTFRNNTFKSKGFNFEQFETGGLADFTGPAWLDGTPSKPEYILNAKQTEKFFSLIDVLERYDEKADSKKSSGDNYFDIEINVEKLENDYDVEKVADKIRRMIYEDASYRNVNTINHIR